MSQIISNYIGILIFCIGEIIFAKIVLNKKIETKKIQTVLILLIAAVFSALCSTYLEETIKSAVIYIIHIFEFKLLFNLSYYRAMFLSFLFFVVVIVVDILNLVLVTNMVGLDKINEFTGSIFSNLLGCILLIIVTLILKKPLIRIMNTEISNNTKIVGLSILTLVCITMFLYIFGSEFKIDGNAIPYLSVMVVLTTILFSLIKQTIENSRLTQEYDHLLEFMKTYEVEIEKQRILRHEVKNEILSIRAKICDKAKNQEILDYIDEILNEKIVVKQEIYQCH